jgi:hypothetical protein
MSALNYVTYFMLLSWIGIVAVDFCPCPNLDVASDIYTITNCYLPGRSNNLHRYER